MWCLICSLPKKPPKIWSHLNAISGGLLRQIKSLSSKRNSAAVPRFCCEIADILVVLTYRNSTFGSGSSYSMNAYFYDVETR